MNDPFVLRSICTRCGKIVNQVENGWEWPKRTCGDGGSGSLDSPGPYVVYERLCIACWAGLAKRTEVP